MRRINPRLAHKTGRFLAIGQERLVRRGIPSSHSPQTLTSLSSSNWAVVLDQRSFRILFREIGIVDQIVPTWILGTTDHLAMTASSPKGLREVALRDSVPSLRLQDIIRRRHLAYLSRDWGSRGPS